VDDCWNAGGVSRFSGRRTKFKKYFISEDNLKELRQLFGERLTNFIEAVKRLEAKVAA
jgi:hypothetical protein